MLKFDQKGFASTLVIIILLSGLAAGTYLVQQRTNFLPQAASNKLSKEQQQERREIKKSIKDMTRETKLKIKTANTKAQIAAKIAIQTKDYFDKLSQNPTSQELQQIEELVDQSTSVISEAKTAIDNAASSADEYQNELTNLAELEPKKNKKNKKNSNLTKATESTEKLKKAQENINQAEELITQVKNQLIALLSYKQTGSQKTLAFLAKLFIKDTYAGVGDPIPEPAPDDEKPSNVTSISPAIAAAANTLSANGFTSGISNNVDQYGNPAEAQDGGDGINGPGY